MFRRRDETGFEPPPAGGLEFDVAIVCKVGL